MNVYVVIGDPKYYAHFDSVWLTLEQAMNYVVEKEREARTKEPAFAYNKELFAKGAWELSHCGEFGEITVWGYPGHGASYGIVTRTLTNDGLPDCGQRT